MRVSACSAVGFLTIAALAASSAGCARDHRNPPREFPDLAAHVSPWIGTKGSGNVFLGPAVPHGMVKLGPDTNVEPFSVDGYEYDNDRIQGFSHTHLEGPGGGWNGYSQVLVAATTGALEVRKERFASHFSHETESAAPGYYAVTLEDYGIRAETTASAHCGVLRFTFPRAADARILIDLGHTRGLSLDGAIEVVGDDTVRGYGVYQVFPLISLAVEPTAEGTTGVSKVYFVARFNRPFRSHGTWQGKSIEDGSSSAKGARVGAWLGYETAEGDVVEARVGISFLSVEQAASNLEKEVADRRFDEIRAETRNKWNRLLSRVEIEGGTPEQEKIFTTALYHSLLQPADYTEGARFWSGADGEGAAFPANGWHYYTDDWCLWDTFRTSHPLLTLVEPEIVSDIARSMVHLYEQGGWMQKCSWNATGDSRDMTANHGFCVVADDYRKGFQGFDAGKAWEAMKKGSLEDSQNLLDGFLCGYLNQGTPSDYVRLGYVPRECDRSQSVSMTLEYALDDWCVSRMAEALGNEEDRRFFEDRSHGWQNVWNPAHGFVQQKTRGGEWVEPFDPDAPDGFTEGDSWTYTWLVPQDVCGLAQAMGGTQPFVERLDAFFFDGHHNLDNEPGFHVPFLYDVAGVPWKTQDRVSELLRTEFSAEPDGLPGNDDSGATSAWYVLAAIGLYPVMPADGTYWLSSPIFERVKLHLDPDRKPGVDFLIEAKGASAENRFIQAAVLNGRPLAEPRLSHGDIVAGGRLILEMGPTPSTWGSSSTCIR